MTWCRQKSAGERKELARNRKIRYDVILLETGIAKKQIHHYGFAFEGKHVLIDGE